MGTSVIPAASRRVASSGTRSESMPGFLPCVPAGGNLLQVRVPAVS